VRESRLSIQQELIPEGRCFGCGPANERGLHLQSYRGPDYERDGHVLMSFRPWPEHDNGLGALNGGIIATLLDCHAGAAMMQAAADRDWLDIPNGVVYVTVNLDVRYRRPAPATRAVQGRAWATGLDESVITIQADLHDDETCCATSVSTWKRWRPRT
jgi:acyl-coenzyme A thioesterase PaaI-like protein